MMPKLRNYTMTIPAEKSIAEIQTMLIEFGAGNIMIIPEGKRVVGIQFLYRISDTLLPFRLPPVKLEKTVDLLYSEYNKSTTRGKKDRNDFYDDAYKIS